MTKSTQVLALAIFAVFCAGALRVLWRNRYVKMHEQLDIEKKARIQELRKSGKFIEPKKSQDVPFGVRAIQSGIQVDGIWISGKNVPVRENLKLGHHAGNPSGSSSDSEHPPGDRHTRKSRDKRSSVQAQRGSIAVHQVLNDRSKPPSSGPSGYSSYKPRRSSHLRFGSYGDTKYDGDTLAQLEGQKTSHKKASKNRAQESDEEKDDASSGHGADNERSSTDSDFNFQHAPGNQGLSSQPPLRIKSLQSSPKLVQSSAHREPLRAQFSDGHYTPVPLKGAKKLPLSRSSNTRPSVEHSRRAVGDLPPKELSSTPAVQNPDALRESESFAAGELHINRTSRVVNSGFEVLPAGTFGTPTEFRGSEAESSRTWQQQVEDERDRRQSHKIQKKGRTSLNLGRASFGNERP